MRFSLNYHEARLFAPIFLLMIRIFVGCSELTLDGAALCFLKRALACVHCLNLSKTFSIRNICFPQHYVQLTDSFSSSTYCNSIRFQGPPRDSSLAAI